MGVGSAAGLSGEFLGIQQGGWAASFSSTLSRLFHSVLKDRGRLPVGPAHPSVRLSGPGLDASRAWITPHPTCSCHPEAQRREPTLSRSHSNYARWFA